MSDSDRETGSRLDLKFNDQGLVAAVVQDLDSGRVLMLGWMNEAALRRTLETRKATFFSRSRNKMWVKGESSGHIQEVVEARIDGAIPPHAAAADELVVVLDGRLRARTGGAEHLLGPGDHLIVPAGTIHEAAAETPARLLLVGPPE